MKFRSRRFFLRIIKSKKISLLLLFTAVILTIIGIVIYNRIVPESAVETLAEEAKTRINEDVSELVSEYLHKNKDLTEKCVETVRDGDGEVISYVINYDVLETVHYEIIKELDRKLKQSGNVSIKVPIGSLSANKYFEGKGFKVKLRGYTLSSVDSNVKTSIDSVGINQSVYKANLEVNITCRVGVGGVVKSFDYFTSVNLIEIIFKGEVPLTK